MCFDVLPKKMPDDHADLIRRFMEAFEEVFDRDWSYTKEMLGTRDQTPEQRAECEKLGLETIPIVADDGTFLNPKVEDEVEDWGHRGLLLELYRELKERGY